MPERGAADVCAIANNHILDFGYRGLADTLRALNDAGIQPLVPITAGEAERAVMVAGAQASASLLPRVAWSPAASPLMAASHSWRVWRW
ncbi:bacterial capsule synthesis PGA_cap family protein [Mycobacterium xenopi 4042]|uniref:Bacterial capsule synthesis PGA_cap family protein n=1 Tax=Mycobacterium xenopi 4042 TaxID=1299334 RepID=X8C728_MYCXE|nr:bacterial capsule synthesis PGA_cap family protein [Mycobacterium xenopi 4042]